MEIELNNFLTKYNILKIKIPDEYICIIRELMLKNVPITDSEFNSDSKKILDYYHKKHSEIVVKNDGNKRKYAIVSFDSEINCSLDPKFIIKDDSKERVNSYSKMGLKSTKLPLKKRIKNRSLEDNEVIDYEKKSVEILKKILIQRITEKNMEKNSDIFDILIRKKEFEAVIYHYRDILRNDPNYIIHIHKKIYGIEFLNTIEYFCLKTNYEIFDWIKTKAEENYFKNDFEEAIFYLKLLVPTSDLSSILANLAIHNKDLRSAYLFLAHGCRKMFIQTLKNWGDMELVKNNTSFALKLYNSNTEMYDLDSCIILRKIYSHLGDMEKMQYYLKLECLAIDEYSSLLMIKIYIDKNDIASIIKFIEDLKEKKKTTQYIDFIYGYLNLYNGNRIKGLQEFYSLLCHENINAAFAIASYYQNIGCLLDAYRFYSIIENRTHNVPIEKEEIMKSLNNEKFVKEYVNSLIEWNTFRVLLTYKCCYCQINRQVLSMACKHEYCEECLKKHIHTHGTKCAQCDMTFE